MVPARKAFLLVQYSNMEEKKYSVTINKKIYWFYCNDGEEYVKELKKKLIHVVNSLLVNESSHILSDYAMKIALLLADDAVRAEIGLKKQEEKLQRSLSMMIEKLGGVLEENV